jgi:superfamily II DNA or RNA helicase/diadenosine tetraphosphate (Ap4A) HIT family hydrolase/HKD family nuclease
VTPSTPCPFCNPEAGRIFFAGERVLGLWDAFPVSEGHALLVPKRHVATWFDASEEEKAELTAGIDVARQAIERRVKPDGYNIGINVGRAAGQTVFHLHVHVIPRVAGDVPDPRGGVRHVVPAKGNYLVAPAASGSGEAGSALPPRLVRGGADPLLPELIQGLAGAKRVDCAVAFVLVSGVERLRPHLRDVVQRGGRVRLVAGDYLDVTEPHALRLLLDVAAEPEIEGRLELRVFESSRVHTGYHPKGYLLFTDDRGTLGSAFVGSSNLSRAALSENVEWSFRIVDATGLASVREGFEALWASDATAPLTAEWVEAYAKRRRVPVTPAVLAGGAGGGTELAVEVPAPEPPPEPHPIQAQALAALRATHTEGNQAALVVLATGLGKTWLAAFDTKPFGRVLFVAHRDEILGQAFDTFRRVRPAARLGYYTGQAKAPDAEVVFASVQTLSRPQNLKRFARDAFDYVVIDEFHHASARTYRDVINWFTPEFLLGLTATPERTDGGDLLALCGENLAYRCDLSRGIDEDLLSPFRYFGVPDDVDYAQIPWRSQRFDEEELTRAVATDARARNALAQWRKLGGRRTLGFCVSQRHADFMAEFFRCEGVAAAAVHSGETSAPRAASLERLEDGELSVVFAVDLFNEGVDIPAIDTVLMLRPTESRIVYLQQLGRGLRKAGGKEHLTVIDYIGNHRIFLTKVRALLGLDVGSDAEISMALRRLAEGELTLPRGCEVTYELEAREILASLLRESPGAEDVRRWYETFKDLHGARPTAVEAMHEGFNPRAVRKHYGSWLGFVEAMGDLGEAELQARTELPSFLEDLETTQMSRSYKMLVLLAMLNEDRFPGAISIEELTRAFARVAARSARLRSDVSVPLDDAGRLRKLIEQQPIPAWTAGKGTGGVSYFRFADSALQTTFAMTPAATAALQDLVRELADWRLADYLLRAVLEPGVVGQLRVSHNKRDPILFFDRSKVRGLPEGWTRVEADGREYDANFVKTALNVARRPSGSDNTLPALLRGWFGDHAGAPGTAHWVVCERTDHGYRLRPRAQQDLRSGATRLQRYQRRDIPELFGATYNRTVWDQGYVRQAGHIVLLVTLEKKGMRDEHAYADRFVSDRVFEWSSQNQMSREMPMSLELKNHEASGVPVHLFVRAASKVGGATAPFIYLGEVRFRSWEGDKPIAVTLELSEPVPAPLWTELRVAQGTTDAG